ncbi:cytochrome c peroxidase [Maribacter sp. SA7]|uniref:cytochrome-c peroxidase n=1 Tax=Maribacter zhoushanensis TaxID=3030012 RepID=UPI0023EBB4C8|nr:cytochrome c peroxidase [Maribacter zhoushanensis]MDF4202953.1 cytochrome c peroxidase [Maribacter zhoushanensis]
MKKYVVTLCLMTFINISCGKDEYIEIPEEDEEVVLVEDDTEVDTTVEEQTSDIVEVDDSILNLPDTPFNYANILLPDFFFDNDVRDEDNTPNNNATTDNGATLGRVLFYDKNLSMNNTISCASCHIQENGFSDPNALSTGFNGELTARNSMGLANARFYENGRFFWDERAATLEEQTLVPIQDLVEMGLSLPELEAKLTQQPYYAALFTNAFGDATITSNRVALALSQFIRSMVSYESKFDEGLAQTQDIDDNFPNFTTSENRGKQLFMSNQTRCFDCHATNVFVGDDARNNGLDATITDLGVGGVTGNNNELGEFKVPSLRNIALTGPYMHDGRFETLDEVIEHYNSGVQNNPNLDNRLTQGNNVRRLNLSDADKQALVDFLNTLTDDAFINDEKYASPFLE